MTHPWKNGILFTYWNYHPGWESIIIFHQTLSVVSAILVDRCRLMPHPTVHLQTICWYLSSQLLEIEGVSYVELFFFGHPPKVLPAVQQALTSKQPEAEIVMDRHIRKFAWGCFSEMYDKQIQNNSTFQCRTWESVKNIVYCLNCVVAELNWILNLYTCIILYQGVVNWYEGLRNHPAQPFQHWLVQMIICIMSLCFPSYFMQLGYERVTKIESLGRGFFSFHYRLPAPTC